MPTPTPGDEKTRSRAHSAKHTSLCRPADVLFLEIGKPFRKELKMGDIGVRVGWGVVSWLYAARDTVAACSHNSTIWHNDGHNDGHNEME